MKKLNNTTLVFIAISVILAVLLLKNIASNTQSQYNSTTILNKIENLQELTLVKYNYNGIIGYKDTMKVMNLPVPFTEKYFLLKYYGYVKAGVDLKNSAIESSGKKIKVTIENPKITETIIDEKSIHVYDESKNPFNPTSITEYNRAIVKEKNTITKDAIKQGILQDASKQVRLVLSGMLKEMGYNNIEIIEKQTVTLPAHH